LPKPFPPTVKSLIPRSVLLQASHPICHVFDLWSLICCVTWSIVTDSVTIWFDSSFVTHSHQ
jgi:hypothetical protein